MSRVSSSDFAGIGFSAPETYFGRNRFAMTYKTIRRKTAGRCEFNLVLCQSWWFVDARSLGVCALHRCNRARKWSRTLQPSFNYFQFLRLPSLSNAKCSGILGHFDYRIPVLRNSDVHRRLIHSMSFVMFYFGPFVYLLSKRFTLQSHF